MALNRKIAEQTPLNHVAIIMDGNGRWAQERGFSRLKGHEEGVRNAKEIVQIAQRFGIKYLTLYAFSTENWERPKLEVKALLNLLEVFLKQYSQELICSGIRVHVIGKYQEMPSSIALAFDQLIRDTEHCAGFNLILAINYSSRMEIVEAIKAIVRTQEYGEDEVDGLNWEKLSGYLYTKEIPDPDLIIRTSGECRLSNFLLLQGAYSEIFFSSAYWPDFKEIHFKEAIESYYSRERRFGKTSDQLKI